VGFAGDENGELVDVVEVVGVGLFLPHLPSFLA